MNKVFRIILITVVTGLCCFQAKAQNITAQKQQLIDQYNAIIKGYNGSYADSVNKPVLDSAIRILYQMERLDTTEVQLYIYRARLYDDNCINKENSALKDMSHAIRLNDTCFSCYEWRADYYRYRHILDKGYDARKKLAATDYSKLIALDSNYFNGYDQLWSMTSDPVASAKIERIAQGHFRRLVDADSTIARSWYLLGKAYRFGGYAMKTYSMSKKCLCAFNKAVELDSTVANYFYERGSMLYFFKKDYKGCIRDMQKVIDLGGHYQDTDIMASAYEDMGDYQSALDAINRHLAIYPDDNLYLSRKTDLLKKMKAKGITPKK